MGRRRNKQDYEFGIKSTYDGQGLDRAERGLDDYERALRDLSDEAREVDVNFDAADASVLAFAGTVAEAAGSLLSSGITKAIEVGANFAGAVFGWDDAMRAFGRETGTAVDELGEYRDIAQDIYAANFGESIEDVVDSMATVHNLTNLEGEALEEATTYALALADTFEYDVQESIRAADTVAENFGTDMETIMDGIVYAAQETGDPLDDLLDTINEYGAIFADAGYSAEDMFASLVQGSDAGVYNLDKIGDAVKEFNIRTLEGGDAVSGAWDDLFGMAGDIEWVRDWEQNSDGVFEANMGTISSFEELQDALAAGDITMAIVGDRMREMLLAVEDPVQRNALAVAMLGPMYEDLGDGVLEAFNIMDDTSAQEGAADRLVGSYNSLGDAYQGFIRQVQVGMSQTLEPLLLLVMNWLTPFLERLGVFVTTVVVPAFRRWSGEMARRLGPWLKRIGEFIEDIQEPIQEVVSSVKDWIAENEEIAEYVVIFAAVAGAITAITVAAGILTTILGVLGTVGGLVVGTVLSPIILIAAAVAALVLAYRNNFLGLRDAVDSAVAAIMPHLERLAAWFKESVIPVVLEKLKEGWQTFKDTLVRVWNAVSPYLAQFYDWFVTNALPLIKGAFQLWLDMVESEIALFKRVWDGISPYLSQLYDWFVTTALPIIIDGVQGFIDILGSITTTASDVWSAISPVLAQLYDWFVTNALPAVETAIEGFVNLFDSITMIVRDVWSAISPTLASIYDWFVVNALPIVLWWIDTIKSGISAWADIAIEMWSRISPVLASLYDWFTSTALPFIIGMVDDFWGAIDAVKGLLMTLWSTIGGTMETLKTNFERIWGAIKDAVQPVADVIQTVSDLISGIDLGALGGIVGSVGGAIGGLIGGDQAGGPRRAGRGGWIGENRKPEWFVPGASGYILAYQDAVRAMGAAMAPAYVGAGGGGGITHVILELDGEVVHEAWARQEGLRA